MSSTRRTHPLVWPGGPVVRRALIWLLFLGPFFYLSYGAANYLASLRGDVGNIALAWERHIPFMAWSIIPYWSINLFYVTTLFANDAEADVSVIAKRYLTCQLIAVSLFVLFPLQAIFVKPETSGLTGFMFDALGSFDRPFNQAPSLHIALLVIIWHHWRSRFQGPWLTIWHFWCALIALSVLTTFQHHVLDIPTGALLGLFALWLVPDRDEPGKAPIEFQRSAKSRKIASYYALAALFFVSLSALLLLRVSPLNLLWLWPAIAMGLTALAYWRIGVTAFQKRRDGTVSLASYWLFMPYRWGARVNAWLWTRRLSPHIAVSGNVYLGRFPSDSEIKGFRTAIDLTGEMLRPKHANLDWQCFPVLDLTTAPHQVLNEAAQAIQKTQQTGKVLVFCALGMQRSAAAVALWLVQSGRAAGVEEALQVLQATGRPVQLEPATIQAAWKAE